MITRAAAASLVVCLAAVGPYLPTLDDYFVQDDFGVVWLLSGKPWSYLPRWFVTTWMDDIWGFTPDEVRPFPAITYRMAAVWGAGSPVPNHIINVALHAANGLLVLAVARAAAGLSMVAATIAAVAFVLLPNQAESVAWVTGRVDSMPAFVFLCTVIAYARWRRSDRPWLYWASVALCFVALFTKQTMITVGPALVLYDVIVERRPVRLAGDWLRPYVPFAALTVGYLALRYVLFGEVARESQLSASGFEYFVTLAVRHLSRIAFGSPVAGSPLLWALVAAFVAAVAWARPRQVLFFGVLWFALGVAPVLVAAYESPRHVYLASVGWALVLGLAFDAVPRHTIARRAAELCALAVLSVYVVQLVGVVADWTARALVSQKAALDLQREARAAPPGALIVAAAPVRSWEWAVPFVLRTPFATENLEGRVRVVTPQALHCCRGQWEAFTRQTLREWLTSADRPPAIALRWDAETGALFRLSDRDEPYLRPLIAVLADTDSADALDRAITNLTDSLTRPGS